MANPDSASPATTAEKGNDYVVVARRYRPAAFDQLIGQQHVARALSRAIETHRVGHAYLFTGARGVGKTSTARILAKALNCAQGPTPTPCGECDICLGIASGDDVDVLEIDGASNRGIDEIRQLRQNANVRPSRARFKIYIIDEVHMLTKEAFNALLKTLEEPPEHVKFIFATTEANKIPITILSRCQRFDFAGIDTADISRRLQEIATAEGIGIDAEALQILARRAAGSMRDSQSLLEQLLALGLAEITAADVHQLLGTAPEMRLLELAQSLAAHDAKTALAQLDEAVRQGVEVAQLVDQLLGMFRDIMAASVGCEASQMLNVATRSGVQSVQELSRQLGMESVLATMQVLEQASARMRGSLHSRALAEMALVRVAHLERLDDLASLIESVQSGEPLTIEVPAGGTPNRSSETNDNSKKNDRAEPEPTARSVASPPPQHATAPAQSSREPVPSPPRATPAPAPRSNARPAAAIDPNSAFLQSASEEASEEGEESDYRPREDRSNARSAQPEQTNSAARNPTGGAPGGMPLTRESATAVWREALKLIDGIAGDQGALCRGVANTAPNRLVVSFGKKYTLSKDLCEKPEQKTLLEDALAQVTGERIRLEFALVEDTPEQSSASVRPKSISLRQLQAEVVARPIVKRAMELFDVENPRVDIPQT
jgi:DNA polymerase-3 subunit gamma/tau